MRSRRSSGKKRALGWLLSALVLALNLTPEAALLRSLPERISLAAGQELALGGADALTLRLHRAASASGDETLGADTATLSLLGWFPLRDVQVEIADDRVVYPGGQ
ncbi:MAG: hypothetical protein PHY12_13935, partial [Eubacteriales bacterium]|nr:hypothetical protein [Eubacteriales bacterium]